MECMIEDILKDDFVEYSMVYKLAKIKGMSKKQVREDKQRIGVKIICIVNGDERVWLWYIPKNVWNKYYQKKLKSMEGWH